MDIALKNQKYSLLMTEVLRKAAQPQPRLQSLKVSAICDPVVGQFLIVLTGWNRDQWLNSIIFHAELSEERVIILDNNLEEDIVQALIEGGIDREDIVTPVSEFEFEPLQPSI